MTFDGRGNGKSDRPEGPDAYAESEFAADALAVLDATETDKAFLVGFSMGAQRTLLLAAEHPERVEGVVFIGPAVPLGVQTARVKALASFDEGLDSYEGWNRYNRHYWLENYADFLQFFFSQMFIEPHSTKQIEDSVGWGLETTPETLVDTAARAGARRGGGPRARGQDPLPGARDARDRGRGPLPRIGSRARRGGRRDARHARGLGPRATRARSRCR